MLTKLNHLIEHADKKEYAVAAFNVSNVREAELVLRVAEKRKESVVLQYNGDYAKVTPLDEFGPKLVELAKTKVA
ncbi:MAG: class II fructose-bisphosphate aldolase [Lachnospiraceae bacterium]|nr:class II fructose-bisphosphate aldolase [Lachnospiraceae bacterium]